jgi:hypothetical protein
LRRSAKVKTCSKWQPLSKHEVVDATSENSRFYCENHTNPTNN